MARVDMQMSKNDVSARQAMARKKGSDPPRHGTCVDQELLLDKRRCHSYTKEI